jgi:tRNA(Ile2) C34 agmatinyltransferase TiaS
VTETYVRLLCPECTKEWESSPDDLPGSSRTFRCPGCQTERPLSEFMRTEHDLKTLKRLS